jgi:hypothetical protein
VRGIVHPRRDERSQRPNRQAGNTFDPVDPRFDTQFVPQAPEYASVGYRPAKFTPNPAAGRT